jgi:hypothetical protein
MKEQKEHDPGPYRNRTGYTVISIGNEAPIIYQSLGPPYENASPALVSHLYTRAHELGMCYWLDENNEEDWRPPRRVRYGTKVEGCGRFVQIERADGLIINTSIDV